MYIGKRPDESILEKMNRSSMQRKLSKKQPVDSSNSENEITQPLSQRKSLAELAREKEKYQQNTDEIKKQPAEDDSSRIIPDSAPNHSEADSDRTMTQNYLKKSDSDSSPRCEKIRQQMENEGFPFDLEERLLKIINDDSLHRKQKRYKCKHLIGCNFADAFLRDVWLEWCKWKMSGRGQDVQMTLSTEPQSLEDRQAEHIKYAINRINPKSPNLHIGFKTVRQLIQSYGYEKVERAVKHIQQRDNIRRPAGFLIEYLRSNARIEELNTP
jgi:hypothetical protein